MKRQTTREWIQREFVSLENQFNYSRNGASIEQEPRRYRFRFAAVCLLKFRNLVKPHNELNPADQ